LPRRRSRLGSSSAGRPSR